MKTNEKGITLIKRFEGLSLKAVWDVNGYSIGYGHHGNDVKKDMEITKEKAELLLKEDLARFEKNVDSFNDIYNFNSNEFSALVSFTYNLGFGNLKKLLANGCRTKTEIKLAMTKYVNVNGKPNNGLLERRKKELELFEEERDNFFTIPNKKTESIVEALKMINIDSSYSNRKKIAIANDINNYRGSMIDNMNLLTLLYNGKLRKR